MKIETKELNINENLKKKVDMICKFTNAKATYENGIIKNIIGTNIAFVRPHIITIKQNKYLIFDECDDIFINGYQEKIKLKDLENYIKGFFKNKCYNLTK